MAKISETMLQALKSVWFQSKALNASFTYLAGFGLTHHQIMTITKKLGNDTVAVLKNDPYQFELEKLNLKQLQQLSKDNGLPKSRPKKDLIEKLILKNRALKQAQEEARKFQETINQKGLGALSVSDLEKLALERGISLYMTRQDVLDLLDELEPNIDHTELSGKELAEAKRIYRIGNKKNKRQLVKAIEKNAGQELEKKSIQ